MQGKSHRGDTCKANHKGDPGDLLGYAGLPEVPGDRIAHPEWDILSLYFYVGRRDGAGSPKGLEALEIRLSSASPSVRVHVSINVYVYIKLKIAKVAKPSHKVRKTKHVQLWHRQACASMAQTSCSKLPVVCQSNGSAQSRAGRGTKTAGAVSPQHGVRGANEARPD